MDADDTDRWQGMSKSPFPFENQILQSSHLETVCYPTGSTPWLDLQYLSKPGAHHSVSGPFPSSFVTSGSHSVHTGHFQTLPEFLMSNNLSFLVRENTPLNFLCLFSP